jgi:hypothetical protein
MKLLVVFSFSLLFSLQAYSTEQCGLVVLTGDHFALDLVGAEDGAEEESTDRCYPGKATEIAMSCSEQQDGIKCEHTIECSYCGDNMKYIKRHFD